MTEVSRKPRGQGSAPDAALVSRLIDLWVAEDIVNREQSQRMRESAEKVLAHSGVRSSTALAGEALGYLGGVLASVAAVLIAARYWDRLAPVPRLGLLGAAAGLLLGGGIAAPERLLGAGERLRAVLWLAATVAVGGFLAVLGTDVVGWRGEHVAELAFAGATACAAALWAARPALLQQAALAVGVGATAAIAVSDAAGTQLLPGLAAWTVAVIWFLLGWSEVLGPGVAVLPLAAAAAIVAGLTTVSHDAGVVVALLTAGATVVVAVLLRSLILLAVGSLGLLGLLPLAVTRWFPDTVLVPAVLLTMGLLLVAVAVFTARRRARRAADASPVRRAGSIPVSVAVGASALLSCVVGAVIVAAALA